VTADDTAEQALELTVAHLREELEGLRTAMRSRAVIDQAKGMIMERYGCDAEAAFGRLKLLSQHANVKLVDVAAALVESPNLITGRGSGHLTSRAKPAARPGRTAHPGEAARAVHRGLTDRWPRRGSPDEEFGTRLRAQGRRARVRSELLAARSADDVLAAVVRTALAPAAPSAAALVSLDASGVVQLLATHGVPASQAARWHALPLDLDLPVCAAMRSAESRWLTRDVGADDGPHELGLGLPDRWARAALVPLLDARGCVGLLALTWPPESSVEVIPERSDDPATDARTDRELLLEVAAAVTVVLRRLGPAAGAVAAAGDGRTALPGPAGSAIGLLDATLNPLLLCRPIIDGDPEGTDLMIVHATPSTIDPAGRGPTDLIGQRFLELYPEAVRDGVWSACRQVMATGTQIDLASHSWRVVQRDATVFTRVRLRITRYRDGVMITWGAVRPESATTGPEGAR
jgi:hypothetical protein